MPEEICTDLSKVLEILEDKAFDTTIIRKKEYDIIQNVLDSGQLIDVATIERVLTVCIQELDNGKNYSSNILKIISSILKKIQNGELSPLPQFTALALAILNTIRSTALLKKLVTLQAMCFETFSMFPNETLLTVFTNHSTDVVEVLSIYCNCTRQEFRILVCDFLIRFLKMVPLEIKTTFIKENLHVWFPKLIPALITFEINGVYDPPKPIEALEEIAEALQAVEYSEDPHWNILLQAIHHPKKYPSVLLSLLESDHPYWDRLWIIFIKLLKNQTTRNSTQGAAINSLLPVVEKAFRMDVTNRCRAFRCWDALIDNFKVDADDVYVTKRLKLLIIPLKLNNAKVEETAIVKFNTWWHLIVEFQNRLDKFIEPVLISFLNFCFGDVSKKIKDGPGLISNNTKKLCLVALMEIAGHLACDSCDNVRHIPKLTRKLMTTSTMVCYWNNFIYCLQIAITIAANDSLGVKIEQVQCLWKSFVLTTGELPDNNIRKDIFNGLLSTLDTITKEDAAMDDVDKSKLEIMILHLICSLFSENDPKVNSLLKTTNDEGPVYQILTIILGPISSHLYNSNDTHECVKKLKHITNFVTNSSICSHIVSWLLKKLTPNNHSLVLWTALAESIYENSATNTKLNFEGVLLWPLQNIEKFTDVKFASSAWHSLYSLAYKKIKSSGKDKVISDLIRTMIVTDINKTFLLDISLVILKDKLLHENVNNSLNEIEIITAAMQKIEDYQEITKEFPVLVDNFHLLSNKIMKTTNNVIIEHTVTIAIKTLKIIVLSYTTLNNNINNLSIFIKDIHNCINEIYTYKADLNLKQKIIKGLMEYLSIGTKEYPLRHNIIFLLNTYLLEIRENQSSFHNEMTKSFDSLVSKHPSSLSKTPGSTLNQNTDKNNFSTPVTNVITRKAKKREASIINTVVENGEEYVVVNSNWKFNPKKLTENQKEKMKRKREDIPALYQDLSQSQDEFKLTTWNTDSQDTSTTNSSKSNSMTTEDARSILKNIPSLEVVPKILEHMLVENFDNKETDIVKDKPLEDSSNKMKQLTPKNTKSPRIALKDRVFKNMKNLMEKSQVHQDVKDTSEGLLIDKTPITPVTEEKSASVLTNSAPPTIAERPSRVKRKPKKFADTEIFALKKRRNSCSQNYSQLNCEQISDISSVHNNTLQFTTNEDKNLLVAENSPTECIIKQSHDTRTPKKSDDTKIFALKKRRYSFDQNYSHLKYDQVSNILSVDNNKLEETTKRSEKLFVEENIPSEHVNKQIHVTNDVLDSTMDRLNMEDGRKPLQKDINMAKPTDKSTTLCKKDETSAVKECKIPTEILPHANTSVIVKSSNKELLKDERSISSAISDKLIQTPKCTKKIDGQENSLKTSAVRKSRIEKELAIDMVEGHPFLTPQSEKRITRKQLNDAANSTKRKSLIEKLNKFELKNGTKLDKKIKEKDKQKLDRITPIVRESQESKNVESLEDLPCSEDIIESSQDSTISVKPVKPTLKKLSVVLENIQLTDKSSRCPRSTHCSTLNERSEAESTSFSPSNQGSKDDIEFTQNKTAVNDRKDEELTTNMDTEPIDLNNVNDIISHDVNEVQNDHNSTENMDTEPVSFKNAPDVVCQNTTGINLHQDKDLTENMDTQPINDINMDDIITNNDKARSIILNSEISILGSETQEIAEADTQPTNSDNFVDPEVNSMAIEKKDDITVDKTIVLTTVCNEDELGDNSNLNDHNDDDVTEILDISGDDEVNDVTEILDISGDDEVTEILDISGDDEKDNGVSSPFKDEAQRKKDFLDNTLEISPIKAMSPARDKKSPSPETSNDFVVIKLSSPVHSNGEPFEKCDSPEVFTEDKVSPDKRDLSPTREAINVINNTSPSSSLSLKKNRHQVRSGGRAAQMLGLCVPKGIQTIMNSERSDAEESKRNFPSKKPLRIVYSNNANTDNSEEIDESGKFLKFQRSLPTADCSPSGPILKRKWTEITDEATISPASKRKRVSFHDPPVSTILSVQNYIEPGVIRSPQNSAAKRQERQMRFNPNMKSAKKLDVTCNKLDTVLTKAVESFSDGVQNLSVEDTQVISLDETPAVEIVKTSELNDSDPICPELIDCDDPIDVIATELSSPAMKMVFLNELKDNIVTVGDLAKMTELEVNRLCIKAPKVKVARKVLTDYVEKRGVILLEKPNVEPNVEDIEIETVTGNSTMEVVVQTDIIDLKDTDMQTDMAVFKLGETQTDDVTLVHSYVQTKESASDSTTDVVNTCLAERPDFVEKLSETLEDESIRQIAESRLSFNDLTSSLLKKVTNENAHSILNQVLEQTVNDRLSFLQKYLYESMEPKDLTLLCVRLLHTIHDKPL